MFGSAILDVALGLVFVYCFVSLICTAVREGIEAFLKTRAAYLERGIRELLQDKGATGLARAVYEHPLIAGLYTGTVKPESARNPIPEFFKGQGMPSYIPARTFALALMDIAARGPRTDEVNSHPTSPILDTESMRASVLKIDNGPVQRVLLSAIDLAHGDVERVREAIENWYDTSMDRVSGWYKRSTQFVILIIALILATSLNIDTVQIVNALYYDQALRDAVVAKAGAVAESSAPTASYAEAKQALTSVRLPIGWGEEANMGWSLLEHIPGWLLTAFAASLGAPFWFDLLNKLMVIRSTVKPHEKSPEEGSEDRQPRDTRPKPSPPPAVPPIAAQPPGPPAAVPGPAPTPPLVGVVAAATQPPPDDSCGLVDGTITRDDDLPITEGGVA